MVWRYLRVQRAATTTLHAFGLDACFSLQGQAKTKQSLPSQVYDDTIGFVD